MVPDVAKSGHSFKGAFAYYLHDKRQDAASPHLSTSERVAWTATRNLAVDDPASVERIMIATAKQADELKKAAGIKATGRKSNAHVYAYSLAWHPDEAGSLTDAEMTRAADASLKALGAEGHQAFIVRHTDQKHPHLHIIVNRVHPETGKMLSTSNDHLKLSDWANAYERDRGQIVTPKREEKRQAREAFKEATQRAERSPRPDSQAQPEKRPTAPPRAKSDVAMLKELSDAQKATHKAEWPKLADWHKQKRERIYSDYGAMMKQTAADFAAAKKAVWREYFKSERVELRAFQNRERDLVGIIRNALDATKIQQQLGTAPNRGALAQTFANVLSSQARAAAFAGKTEMQRAAVARQLKTMLDGEMQALREKRGAALAEQRAQYTKDRAALIERQNAERAKIREAWKQVYDGRGKSTDERARSYRDQQQRMQRKTEWQAKRAATIDTRTEQQALRPEYSRPSDRPVAAAQPQKPIRETAATPKAQAAPARAEFEPVKQDFDKARSIGAQVTPKASFVPTYVQKAQPQPTPMGEVRPVPRTLQNVPEKPKPATPAQSAPAQAKRDFSAIAPPPMTKTETVKRDFSAVKAEITKKPAQDLQKEKPTRRPTR